MKDGLNVAIIGAGAAGLMCACMQSPANTVTVFEKNASSGRKLLLTGNRRCNITNLVNPYMFLESVPQNSEFLLSSLRQFSPKDVVRFFEEIGIHTHTEDNNRVFPSAGGASAVRLAMENFAKSRGVNFVFNGAVTDIVKKPDGFELTVNGQSHLVDAVVIATGGLSFSSTGSTGDGLNFADKFGHSIAAVRPSLCGLRLAEPISAQGASVQCGVTVLNSEGIPVTKKQIGSMMFTKNGVSGPVVFETVSKFKPQSICGYFLQIDFEPDTVIPRSVANWVSKTFKPSAEIRVLIQDFEDIETATIMRGGVAVHGINSQTMESKLVPGLFFIGEVLDVDALSGGFNLQIAFSTAAACVNKLNKVLSPEK